MRSASLILLGLCGLFLFSLINAERIFNPVPLVMFGSGASSSSRQQLATIHSSDVETLLNNAISGNHEVVLVFIEPRLKTEQLWETSSFSHLRSLIEDEATVYPYVSADQGVAAAIAKVASSLQNVVLSKDSGAAYLSENPSVKAFTRQELLSHLETSDISSNGVTDVVIVYFDAKTNAELTESLASDDAYLDSLVKVVREKTNGKFVSIFTADKPSLSVVSRTPVQNRRFNLEVRDVQASNSSSPVIYTSYWPIFMLEVYIASFVLLVIAFLGVLCTCNLQTPARFEVQKAHKKE